MFMTQNSDTGLKKYFNINIDWCFYFNTWSLLMFNINTTKKKTILWRVFDIVPAKDVIVGVAVAIP